MVCYYHTHSRCPLKAGCDEFQLDGVPDVLVCVSCLSVHISAVPLTHTLTKGTDSLQWHERGLGRSKVDLSHCEISQVSLDSPFLGVRKYRWWHLDFDLQFLKFQWSKMRFNLRIQKTGFEQVWGFFLTIFIPINVI